MRIYVQVNATPRKATPHPTKFGLGIKAHQGQHPNQHITRYLDRAIASATIQIIFHSVRIRVKGGIVGKYIRFTLTNTSTICREKSAKKSRQCDIGAKGKLNTHAEI